MRRSAATTALAAVASFARSPPHVTSSSFSSSSSIRAAVPRHLLLLPKNFTFTCMGGRRDIIFTRGFTSRGSVGVAKAAVPLQSITTTTDNDDDDDDDDDDTKMRFGSGLSKHEDLAQAVVEAVAEVKATLGHDKVPTFVQLLVSGDYANPTMAPAFALECFVPAAAAADSPSSHDDHHHHQQQPPPRYPALFGGVVTGCIGGRGQVLDGPSVSITAGYMPGVTEAIGFHTEDASLPAQVTPRQWGELMRVAGGGGGGGGGGGDEEEEEEEEEEGGGGGFEEEEEEEKKHINSVQQKGKEGLTTLDEKKKRRSQREQQHTVGVVMLSDPEFAEVDDLMRRMHALLPESKLIGGAVKTGGAFFLGPRVIHSGGAAGVILSGRFGMEVHSLHSCRPVGPPMIMTRGKDGHVLDLDHRSAGAVLRKILSDLPNHTRGLPVMLGVGDVMDHAAMIGDDDEENGESEDAVVDGASGGGKAGRTTTRGSLNHLNRGGVVSSSSSSSTISAAAMARMRYMKNSSGVRALRGRLVDEEEEEEDEEEEESKGNEEEGGKARNDGVIVVSSDDVPPMMIPCLRTATRYCERSRRRLRRLRRLRTALKARGTCAEIFRAQTATRGVYSSEDTRWTRVPPCSFTSGTTTGARRKRRNS